MARIIRTLAYKYSDLYEFHSIKGGHRVLLYDPKEIFTIANLSSLVEVLVADKEYI